MRHNLHICILLFVISFTNPSYLLAVTYTAIFCSLRGYCISLSSSDVFRHAEGLLKRFGSQGDEGNVSQQELTVRSNMQRSMAKKLQGLSMAFRGSQKEHIGIAFRPRNQGVELGLSILSLRRKNPPLEKWTMEKWTEGNCSVRKGRELPEIGAPYEVHYSSCFPDYKA
jgi:hypothetical protein